MPALGACENTLEVAQRIVCRRGDFIAQLRQHPFAVCGGDVLERLLAQHRDNVIVECSPHRLGMRVLGFLRALFGQGVFALVDHHRASRGLPYGPF